MNQVETVRDSIEQVPRRARYDAMRDAQRRAVTADFIRRRPFITLPVATVIVSLLLLAHHPFPRVMAVVAAYTAYLGFQIAHWWQLRSTGKVAGNALFLANIVTFSFIAVNVVATGGLTSPLAPSLLPMMMANLVAYGRSRESAFSAWYTAGVVLVVAFLPPSVIGPRPIFPYDVMITGISLLFTVYMLYTSVVKVADALNAGEVKLDRMREDVLAAAEQRGQALESIGAKVAHELKNPLASIKGLVQLLARKAEDDRSKERFEVVISEVTRMEAILRDYLSFSRPLENLRPESVDVARLVDDVFAVLEARAAASRVTLRRAGDAPTVCADPRRLKEALLNLLSNAIEATEDGAIDVSIVQREDGAEVRVADTGRGIPAASLERIGTPFFTTRAGGTGLGVCLARAVVAQHGGELRYESQEGRGTTAIMTLPAIPSPKPGLCPPMVEMTKALAGI
jgi:signal transduction histidine kinase